MGRFWDNAMQVMDAASNAHQCGPASDLAVLIERSGGLRIVAASGWTSEGLRSHYGADAVYQVTHTAETVSIEGSGPGVSCTLRTRPGTSAISPLPQALALYTVVDRPARFDRPPAIYS